jgi:hypothetical protein
MAYVGLLAMTLMIGLRFVVGGDLALTSSSSSGQPLTDLRPDHRSRAIRLCLPELAAQQLGSDVWLVNLVCGLLTVWGVAALARREPQPWLALLIAIPYLIIVVGMGYTRQAAALGLVMVGLASLLNDRKHSHGCCSGTALAALFHKSAHSTVTLLARLRGWSTSVPLSTAT